MLGAGNHKYLDSGVAVTDSEPTGAGVGLAFVHRNQRPSSGQYFAFQNKSKVDEQQNEAEIVLVKEDSAENFQFVVDLIPRDGRTGRGWKIGFILGFYSSS